MVDLHIEIVGSTILGLSSIGAQSREAIRAVLARHYSRVEITIVNDQADLEALVAAKPDLVFLGMKFLPRDTDQSLNSLDAIWLAEYLDEHGVAYTGSGHEALQLENNKPLAKQRILDEKLETSKYSVVGKDAFDDSAFVYPIFIKPTSYGGGKGIDASSLAFSLQEANTKIKSIARKHGSDSIVEEYLPGREFSVSILKDESSKNYFIMPIELVAPTSKNGARILSNQVKLANTEQVLKISDGYLKSQVCSMAMESFIALGARDYGRIDIRLDRYGHPNFIEANLLPSLIDGYGSFPKACVVNEQLEYEPMILTITRMGLARGAEVAPSIPALKLALPSQANIPALIPA